MKTMMLRLGFLPALVSGSAQAASPAQWHSNGALAVVALKAGLVSEILNLDAEDIDREASRCDATFSQPLSHTEALAPLATDRFTCSVVTRSGATHEMTIPLNGSKILYWGNGYGPAGFRIENDDASKALTRSIRSIGTSSTEVPNWMTKIEVCDPNGFDCLLSYFIKRSVSKDGEVLQGMSCSVHVQANDERKAYVAYGYDCAFYPKLPVPSSEPTNRD